MKSGDIGLLVFQLTKLAIYKLATNVSKLYTRQKAQATLDISTYLDQKYWSDLGLIGLYGKLRAPESF